MTLTIQVAIAGMGCNFPGGEGLDSFWTVLENGRNCTTEIPPERFNISEWYEPDNNKPNKICTTRAALLDEFNAFDHQLFGINKEEAEHIDPQQKLLLECTYRALEDAGVTRENISDTKTGVFVGLKNRDYESIASRAVGKTTHYDGTGTASSTAANRISHTFNLKGPSLDIDTGHSSFLSALHLGYKAIKQGDCEAALCGGVNCIIDPWKFASLSKAKMLSPDGITKPFSKKATGYGRGEGCGVLLLKPLMKAQEDLNKIWGVLSITAVSQNGKPVTKLPQVEQEKLLLSIYPAQINPSVVQYIETHSIGNPAQDTAEAESLGNIIGTKRLSNLPLLKIGSVMGNIGHTESAAGAAGLIKVLLMMHHGKIVPSLHFSESNSSINTKKLNLLIPTTVEKWDESSEFGRVAGINCFGYEGNNIHAVVRQVRQSSVPIPVKRPVELFIISAVSGCSLRQTMEDTARYVKRNDSINLQNLAYTSACRRSHINYNYRRAFLVSSLQQLQQKLISAATIEVSPSKKPPQLIFVFSGNELNFKGICKILLKSEPIFRDKCAEIKKAFQQLSPTKILELTETENENLSKPEIVQPLIFTLQVALVTLLQYWGIKPIATVGHSVGEVAAAHCAGLISLEDAVKVIHHRSRLQAKVIGGKMLVVGNIPVHEVSEALGAYSGKVCIAAFNSPQSCTLSGDADAIYGLQKHLAEHFSTRNIFLHVLNVPAAYHSHMMDPILTELAASLSDLKKRNPEIDLISSTTGKFASDGDFVTGSYWARQAREAVCFAEAIVTSAKDKDNIAFVEIGSPGELKTYITETLGAHPKVFNLMQTDREYMALLNMAKDLFELGFNVDWQHFYEGYQSIPAAYPRYQFEHKRLTSHHNISRPTSNKDGCSSHSLIFRTNEGSSEFICTISEVLTPYLYEHKNHNVALIAEAFFAELALAAVMTRSRPKVPLRFCQMNIMFTQPYILNENSHVLKITVESQERLSDFQILSGSTNVVYVSGQVTKYPETPLEEKIISFKDIFHRCKSVIEESEVYEALAQLGFDHSLTSRQLPDIFYCEDLKEAITTLKVNQQIAVEMHKYYIHPLLLDCFFQMAVVLAKVTHKNKIGFLSSINSLIVGQSLQEEMMVYVKLSKSTDNYLQFCGCFIDKHGSVLAELTGVQITFVKETPKNENEFLFETRWKEITSEQTMQNLPKAPRVVVFADKSGITQQLKNYLHSESRFVPFHEWDKMLVGKRSDVNAQNKINLELQGYQDVLFMWGIQKLNESLPEKVVKYSVRCCEAFRQVVIALREKKSNCSVTIITYRTSEGKVDHINPGFALYGMTRACMSEVPEISFQIIDISSTHTVDISALADVLVKYKAQDYPEIWIDEGRIYTSEMGRTQIEAAAFSTPSYPLQDSERCILFTANPYDVKDLSAKVTSSQIQLDKHSVEVQIQKISIHSEDYFPVSVSSCEFGKTLYWNSHTTDTHKLLALDISGIVTATGVEVKKIKVGDHITSCYPVSAASRINIPETICFNTQKFPFFRSVPCISFFRIANVVLHQRLPIPKHGELLGIISIEPDSVLCKVLTFIAQELGWKTVITNHVTGVWQRVNQCSALIFLPPLNGIFQEALTCLFHLKDIVLVYGNKQPECVKNLIGTDHENIQIHTVNLTHIFQKASLLRSQKEIYCWLKSMNMKPLKQLPFSLFQQGGERSENTASYFNCKSVPVAVLTSDEVNSKISDITMLETDRRLFKQNAIYIITGGLTGLGLETVKFVAQNGGGKIVILSRRNPSAEMQKELNDLQDHCKWSRIVSLQCNVVSMSEVEKAMKSIGKIFPNSSFKGIFHCAMVLHDGPLETLTMSHFEEVLHPKVAGAINLHRATQGQELDHFVCYSSFWSFFGSATQSNYAAANSFLDLFCHYRRNSGLAGQSINWGALNLGTVQTQHQSQSNALHTKGLEDLQANDIHEYLRKTLILNKTQQAVVKLDFQTLACHVLSENQSLKSRFYNLVSKELGSSNSEFPERAASQNLPLDGPVDYIVLLLKTLVGTIPGDLSLHTPLSSLGIDSALAPELRNRIFVDRRVEISLATLLDPRSTVATLILNLKEQFNTADSHAAEGTDSGSWL
uniref:Carrier domain-containing protein n=1 Tax=Anolis carolinensis TaxID=28377 RepID=A0A803TGC0_ANOCA|nr:PREDICTED: mycocerosic acid synthase isoform X1 [Anolis carolinensis]XP_016849764.1 PREDICTED: mycocerosic acid synthase isoform X1 [Anolis carolinensis]XP_016849765.1 PREDICTED: mycocerosic acid synthase isoform X1 [Anolis carolinensis]|eukprot:XP_016849763.1 PREDICTED: mycocerosic acid synthase isoform X1 [Anolis carolinensis]